LTVEEASGPPTEIWPENVAPCNVFADISTQWRMGPNGPVGLDYNVLFRKLDRLNLTPVAYDQMEAAVRIMEDEVLSVIWAKSKA
jgi:hypothetical protein